MEQLHWIVIVHVGEWRAISCSDKGKKIYIHVHFTELADWLSQSIHPPTHLFVSAGACMDRSDIPNIFISAVVQITFVRFFNVIIVLFYCICLICISKTTLQWSKRQLLSGAIWKVQFCVWLTWEFIEHTCINNLRLTYLTLN